MVDQGMESDFGNTCLRGSEAWGCDNRANTIISMKRKRRRNSNNTPANPFHQLHPFTNRQNNCVLVLLCSLVWLGSSLPFTSATHQDNLGKSPLNEILNTLCFKFKLMSNLNDISFN